MSNDSTFVIPSASAPARDLATIPNDAPVPDLSQYNMGDLRALLREASKPQPYDFLNKTFVRPGSYPDRSILQSKHAQLPWARATRAAAYSQTATGAYQTFVFDSALENEYYKMWSESGQAYYIKFPFEGLYRISVGIYLQGAGAGYTSAFATYLRTLPSTDFQINYDEITTGASPRMMAATGTIGAAKDQVIFTNVYQNSGGNLGYSVSFHTTFMEAVWVGNSSNTVADE